MKNLLLPVLTSLTSIGMAQDAPTIPVPNYDHDLSIKGFYREHKEGSYYYKTGGIGLEYNICPIQGVNYKLSTITNLSEHNVLIETENRLSYKFILNDSNSLYPILGSRYSSHQIGRDDQSEGEVVLKRDVFVNKFTAYTGVGWNLINNYSTELHVEGLLFRDLHNALLVNSSDRFWGRKYSNPAGYKGLIGLSYQISDQFKTFLQGSFAKTFQKEGYQEMGVEFSFKWGF